MCTPSSRQPNRRSSNRPRPRRRKSVSDVDRMNAGASVSAATTRSRQFSTFFLDDLYLGVEVLRVQELIRFQEMTRVPLASPVVRGLINLRGQIVTAIDLRRQFGLPTAPADRDPMNVVVRTDDTAVSLLVDEIGD